MNIPDIKTPLHQYVLRHYYHWRIPERPPRLPINIKKITEVRLSQENYRNGTLIYPEFQHGKWEKFWFNDKPLAFMIKQLGIYGYRTNLSNDNIKKTKKYLYKWLEKWIRDSHLNIRIIRDSQIEEEVDEPIRVRVKEEKYLKDDEPKVNLIMPETTNEEGSQDRAETTLPTIG